MKAVLREASLVIVAERKAEKLIQKKLTAFNKETFE